MDIDEIINTTIIELKNSSSVFIMFKDLTVMKNIKDVKDFEKIRYILLKSIPFEKHTENAIKFSQAGIEILRDFKDWSEYKKSLKPKKDIYKIISTVTGIGMFALAILTFLISNKNSTLKSDLSNANSLADSLELVIDKTKFKNDSISDILLDLELILQKQQTDLKH
jgi:uncharacterized protein YerC